MTSRAPRRRALDAAVATDPDSGAARVVPPGAVLHTVGKAVLGYTHESRRAKRPPTMATLRLAELARLIQHRHGGPCDTDDGEAYFWVALAHFADLDAATAWAAR